MTRLSVPALLLALAVPVGIAAPTQAVASTDVARVALAGNCSSTALGARKAVRTKAGVKLGTARMYAASRGADLGFCVRITPVPRLRSKTTVAQLKHATFYASGERSSNGLIGGSGSWKYPFIVTGDIFAAGSSMKGTASLQAPGGRKATAKLTGTLS